MKIASKQITQRAMPATQRPLSPKTKKVENGEIVERKQSAEFFSPVVKL